MRVPVEYARLGFRWLKRLPGLVTFQVLHFQPRPGNVHLRVRSFILKGGGCGIKTTAAFKAVHVLFI